MNAEQLRLKQNEQKQIPLERWGPYLSERQWGTVREDYSSNGDAWNYFPFSHSSWRAYRWGEDGIGGICDFFGNLCFAPAFWNGKDPILKERLFGLGNNEGNHGEDVKELYYYLDNLPTHYYMRMLYKYPQSQFPYETLINENRKRDKLQTEYEILDTGVFDENRYFDIYITYAKLSSTDIAIRLEIENRSEDTAELTLVPMLWFFNNWQLPENDQQKLRHPQIKELRSGVVKAFHQRLGSYYFYYPQPDDRYFTENETDYHRLDPNLPFNPYHKGAIGEAVVNGTNADLLRKRRAGTRFAPVYNLKIEGKGKSIMDFRFSKELTYDPFYEGFSSIFDQRGKECDAFYDALSVEGTSRELRDVQRQALSGLLWSKQLYYYDVERWLNGADWQGHRAAPDRRNGRNHEWAHLKNHDIISMPDKWEYPWYAAWDLAFQCIPMAMVDPVFSKHQLILIMREWYMKPDGQLPAYEWNFSDVNPPVQAWAAMEVYQIEKRMKGRGDIRFLKRVFQKFMLNFNWWINRKDHKGKNIFTGGFLGLDNIGVFNRSLGLGPGMTLEQADGTSWMGMYALSLMDMALEIAIHDIAFEDGATKFFEHFVLIGEALNEMGLWDEEDRFYYDKIEQEGKEDLLSLKIKSIVGLSPLFAVSIIDKAVMKKLKDFTRRLSWFEKYRRSRGLFWPNEEKSESEQMLLSLIPRDRLESLLSRLLDEAEFLAPGGVRALSRFHEKNPYSVSINGEDYSINYDPGDATSDFFGGNSNWRGPIWMPINYLIIRNLRKYGIFYRDQMLVEFPKGSGVSMNLLQVADELAKRVISLFTQDSRGERKLFSPKENEFYNRPENRNLILFYEYFHGNTGRGLGASHQTGWTALIGDLIARLKPEETEEL